MSNYPRVHSISLYKCFLFLCYIKNIIFSSIFKPEGHSVESKCDSRLFLEKKVQINKLVSGCFFGEYNIIYTINHAFLFEEKHETTLYGCCLCYKMSLMICVIKILDGDIWVIIHEYRKVIRFGKGFKRWWGLNFC